MIKKVMTLILSFIILISCTSCSTKYESWHLNTMNINKLWEKSKGKSQTIAFIDTGISSELYQHLKDRIVSSYNIVDNNDNIYDYHGHGTEMVSIACGDGFKNIFGIAPESKIIIIKAVSDDGKTNNDYLYKALLFATENNADIVNISLGGFKESKKVIEQINLMNSKNISIVVAGGDYGNKDLLFPANHNNVISVEASTKENKIWSNSNKSNESTIRMPGENIDVLTLDENKLLIKDMANGTSQSSAITSGYVALIRDYYTTNNKLLSNNELIDILKNLNTKNDKELNFLFSFE